METQWRAIADRWGAMVIGLDYAAAIGVMRDLGMKRKSRAEMLASLRVMERAALPVLNQRRGE